MNRRQAKNSFAIAASYRVPGDVCNKQDALKIDGFKDNALCSHALMPSRVSLLFMTSLSIIYCPHIHVSTIDLVVSLTKDGPNQTAAAG